MRVLLVHNLYLEAGGEDLVFRAEAQLLRQHGHEVVEYVDDNHRLESMSRLSAAIQTIWSAPSRRNLREMLSRTHPDLVHCHNTFLLVSPSAYYACSDAAVPVVQTLHNYRLICPAATLLREGRTCVDCVGKVAPWPGIVHACYHQSRPQTAIVATMLSFHRVLRTWSRKVHAYIVPSRFAKEKFIEGGLETAKIHVKPNFVSPDPGKRNMIGEYALFVGRLWPVKGVRTLLRAWRDLKGIPLKVVGGGPLLPEVEAAAEDFGEATISALGERSQTEVIDLMRGARFLIVPSEAYETFGRAAAESFACGLPVIASNHGALSEMVQDHATGLLFATGDAGDLKEKVLWAWSHPSEMERFGENARKEYEDKYTAERNYEILIKIYESTLNAYR